MPGDPERAAAPDGAGAETQIAGQEITRQSTSTTQATCSWASLIVLHRVDGLGAEAGAILDALAAASVAIRGLCGTVKVPLRPPFPPTAVHCPICFALAAGEFGSPS